MPTKLQSSKLQITPELYEYGEEHESFHVNKQKFMGMLL